MLHETLEYLGIAFVCSVLLIIMSKIILQALIRRPADYYIAEELRQEEIMLNEAGISITSEHETTPDGVPIEETHLEAQLGDFEAAEPEEIITDIPESVHESLKVSPREEISEDDTRVAPMYTGGESDLYSEDEVLVPDQSVFEVEERSSGAGRSRKKAAIQPDTAEPEPAPAESAAEPAKEEHMAAEPDKEPETETAKEEKTDYTFSIKAKTSRTKRAKNKDAEEAAEDLEKVRSAMDDAKSHAEEDSAVSEWSESYADIRSSLEKAFTDKVSRQQASPETSENKDTGAGNNKNNRSGRNNRNNRRRAPSMNMNRKELVEIAASRGIEVPEEATKREILDLIYSQRRKRY